MIGEIYITNPTQILQKPFVQMAQEVCVKTNSKPLICGFPKDLKVRSVSSSATVQTYTYTSSLMSLPMEHNTSTTTTP